MSLSSLYVLSLFLLSLSHTLFLCISLTVSPTTSPCLAYCRRCTRTRHTTRCGTSTSQLVQKAVQVCRVREVAGHEPLEGSVLPLGGLALAADPSPATEFSDSTNNVSPATGVGIGVGASPCVQCTGHRDQVVRYTIFMSNLRNGDVSRARCSALARSHLPSTNGWQKLH